VTNGANESLPLTFLEGKRDITLPGTLVQHMGAVVSAVAGGVPLHVALLWCGAVLVHLSANQVVAACGQRWLAQRHAAQSLPLLDVGHALLPKVTLTKWQNAALEAWAVLPGLAAVVAGGPQCATLFVRAHTHILVLRPLCFLGTILPDASGVAVVPQFWCTTGGIHDLVFSGHTAAALCGVLSWYHAYGSGGHVYGGGGHAFGGGAAAVGILGVLVAFAGCVCQSLCIVATRKHYTVDVVLAWILCPLLLSYLSVNAP